MIVIIISFSYGITTIPPTSILPLLRGLELVFGLPLNHFHKLTFAAVNLLVRKMALLL